MRRHRRKHRHMHMARTRRRCQMARMIVSEFCNRRDGRGPEYVCVMYEGSEGKYGRGSGWSNGSLCNPAHGRDEVWQNLYRTRSLRKKKTFSPAATSTKDYILTYPLLLIAHEELRLRLWPLLSALPRRPLRSRRPPLLTHYKNHIILFLAFFLGTLFLRLHRPVSSLLRMVLRLR
jgi:hypothetical protein